VERPPVTIGAPARPGAEPDLLVGGEDAGLGPVGRRRLKVLAAVALVGGLAVVVAGEVRERQSADAEEQRLAAVLDLTVEPTRAVEQWARYDEVRQTAELDVSVHVRNGGPRGVRVLAVALGPWALPGDVHVPPGEVAELVLQRSVSCTAAAPEEVAVSGLQLQARTDAGVRSTTLPVDLVLPADAARRACGLVPVEGAVTVRFANRQERDEAYEVGLEVRTATRGPMRLDELRAADGLTEVLLGPDGLPGLPLPWPMEPRSMLQVRLEVADCAVAGGSTGQPLLHLLLHDEAGTAATSDLPSDDVRSALLARAC
jgi:hypothetical protein